LRSVASCWLHFGKVLYVSSRISRPFTTALQTVILCWKPHKILKCIKLWLFWRASKCLYVCNFFESACDR
jgi:hypothetical protein